MMKLFWIWETFPEIKIFRKQPNVKLPALNMNISNLGRGGCQVQAWANIPLRPTEGRVRSYQARILRIKLLPILNISYCSLRAENH